MGASVALAGASACTVQPKEMIVPYVRQPEDFVPGNPLFYATAMSIGRHRDRATGREPSGAADQDRRQSAASGEPRRDRHVHAGERADAVRSGPVADRDCATVSINTWGNFITALTDARDVAGLKKGAGFRILTGTVTSPTLAAQIQEFLDGVSGSEVASV